MKLLILKTNIETEKKVESITTLFNEHPVITDWCIDLEDIDNVLRIEAKDELKEKDIIYMVKNKGFHCEAL